MSSLWLHVTTPLQPSHVFSPSVHLQPSHVFSPSVHLQPTHALSLNTPAAYSAHARTFEALNRCPGQSATPTSFGVDVGDANRPVSVPHPLCPAQHANGSDSRHS
eukprot:360255-Chlamydomonas_euryale.AAC.14